MEEKAGVKKNYQEIEPIEADMKRSQFSNMMMDGINKSHETIFSINNPNMTVDNKKPKTAEATTRQLANLARPGQLSVNLPSKRNELNIQVNINKDGSKATPHTNIDSLDKQKQRLDKKSIS